MADNGNRGSNESFRRNQAMRKRREPPIIDATATDVSNVAPDPSGEDSVTGSDATHPSAPPSPDAAMGEVSEPVLFGNTVREAAVKPAAAAEEPRTDAAPTGMPDTIPSSAEPMVPDVSGSSPPAADPAPTIIPATAVDPALGDKAGSAAAAASAGEPDAASVTSADLAPPTVPSMPAAQDAVAAATPQRRSPWTAILGAAAVILLLVIAGLLYADPQRGRVDSLSAAVDALNKKVSALEARPDPGEGKSLVATLDTRATTLDNQVADLKRALADLTGKVDAAVSKAGDDANRLAALESKANTPPVSPPVQADATPGTPGPAPASAADLSGLAAKVDDLAQKVAALPSGSAPVTPDPAPVQAKLDALAARVDALQGKVTAIPKVDLAPLEAKLETLDHRASDTNGRVAALGATLAALPKVDPAALQSSLASLDKRVAPLETALSAPKTGDRVTEARAVGDADASRAAPLAVVAQAVAQAIEDGRPFVPEVQALKALGVDEASLAPLDGLAAKGSPTLGGLKTRWSAVEPEVLAAVRPKGGSVLDRFTAGARSLVQVRPVGAAGSGEDPGAVTSRIDAKLDHGDLAGALAEWTKLPEAGRSASQGWADAARARLDADGIAQGLVSRAIAMLGKDKG